jgi:hypothetical protein
MEQTRNPTPDEVYNKFYRKYKEANTDEEFKSLIREANELDKKYSFDLCHHMLLDLINIIENNYKERGKANA